jgi:hypothetical protein
VEDANDNPPRMERGVVTAVVSAEAARGVAVARVAAWDPDAADAPRLTYALAGAAPPHHAFAVHPRTGVLTLANTRAWAQAGAHAQAPRSLNVSVSDGAHAAFARVKLTLAPANRSPPHFPHLVHEARALENQPPPLLLTTVSIIYIMYIKGWMDEELHGRAVSALGVRSRKLSNGLNGQS